MKWFFYFCLFLFSCAPQKPNAIRPKMPPSEIDKRDGRIKARDKMDNKERMEYYNKIQHL